MQQLLMYCTHRKIYHKTRIKHSWIHSGCLKSASWLHSSDNHHLQVAQVNIFAAVILQFAKPLHHWSVRSDALNSSFAMFAYSRNRVTVKFWRQYLQNLQSYLEIFIIHLAAAVTLLQTDSISSVYRHIFEIWPVLMAFTWKNRGLLAAFWNKISISHLGQTEHRSVRGDGPLCAQHRDRISFIWCGAT